MTAPDLTPEQQALCSDLIHALREGSPNLEALPGLWNQLKTQLSPAVVERLSRWQVIQKAMALTPPWLEGAQALVAAGATIEGFVDIAMEVALEHHALDVFRRGLEAPSFDPSNDLTMENLIRTAMEHGHHAVALELMDLWNDPLEFSSTMVVWAARQGGPLAGQVVQAALAKESPEARTNTLLRVALEHGQWEVVEALWPPVVPLTENERSRFTQLATQHGHEGWIKTIQGDRSVDAPQLIAALKGSPDGLLSCFLAQAERSVIRDAWNTLCAEHSWAAVDRLTPVAPRHWGQTLLDMAELGQVPRAQARERAFQLQEQPSGARRRSRPRS